MNRFLCVLCSLLLFTTVLHSQNSFTNQRAFDQMIDFQNDQYIYRTVSVDGENLFEVTGFESISQKDFHFPSRTITLVLDGEFSPEITIVRSVLSSPAAAHPFYIVRYWMKRDSSVERSYESLYRSGNLLPRYEFNPTRIERRTAKGKTYVRFSIPVIVWDEEKKATSFVEQFTIGLKRVGEKTRILATTSDNFPTLTGMTLSNLPPAVLKYVDTSASWIDYSKKYISFAVKSDSVLKIDKDWFTAHGVAVSSIDPFTVRLLTKGKEIPFIEKGMRDGSIDDGDYFLFVGKKNYGESNYRSVAKGDEENAQYIDKYDSASVYWITWGGQSGLRAGWLPQMSSTDSLLWYSYLIHIENEIWLQFTNSDIIRQQIAAWTSEDTWHMGWINEKGTANYSVSIKNLISGLDGKGWLKTNSWYGPGQEPAHLVSITFNQKPPIDSVAFNRDTQALLSGTIPAALLKEGANTFSVTNHLNQDLRNSVVVDWFDVEYPRMLIAENNFLLFPVRDQRMVGSHVMRVQGFTDTSIQVLKIVGEKYYLLQRQMIADGSTFSCVIADTLQLDAQYVFFKADLSSRAPIGEQVTFANLRSTQNSAEYIIITNSVFEQGADQYATFLEQQYSLAVKTVYVENIYDEFGYGFFAAEPIKAFLLYTQTKWKGTPAKYVLFLGDANYNYKVSGLTASKPIYPQNFVPSYGFPVGDGWYDAFDSLSIDPSLRIGRLPVRSNEDILFYLDKHRRYVNAPFDDWNKTFFLFSGGIASEGQAALDQLRLTNNRITNETMLLPPIGGKAYHFYKTINPQTDFGPVTPEEYNQILSRGALAISYLGHSGTSTWDNSIIEPEQLNNQTGRMPVITDFGCSTGKFAEPDIVSFSEKFILGKNSQAISYLGNSSLGFTSISGTLPNIFYKTLLPDGIHEIGEAHRLTKIIFRDTYGGGIVNTSAIQSNTLLGDPIIKIAVPVQPNLIVQKAWPRIDQLVITNKTDSIWFSIPYANWGKTTTDSVEIQLEDYAGAQLLTSRMLKQPVPYFYDTLHVRFPVDGIAGARRLKIMLDPASKISEIYETDNNVDFEYLVLNSSVQPLNTSYGYTGIKPDSMTVLNPAFVASPVNKVDFEFDNSDLFSQPQRVQVDYGKVFSRLRVIPPLQSIPKVSWRVRPEGLPEYSGPFQYYNLPDKREWVQQDSADFAKNIVTNLIYQSAGYALQPTSIKVKAISSGWFDGASAVIEKNGVNILPSTFGSQYYVAVLDSITLETKRIALYATWGSGADRDSLNAFLKRVQFGEILVLTTADEPSRGRTVFTDEIKQFGSIYIDSLSGWSSYAFIGRRGAARGTIPEGFKRAYTGLVVIDTTYQVPASAGSVKTPSIGPAYMWRSLHVKADVPLTSSVSVEVYGVSPFTNLDTLLVTSTGALDPIDLSGIDARRYRYIKLQATLNPGSKSETPVLKSWSVHYDYLPELALNYQSVIALKDSMYQGIDFPFELGVVNAGPSPADSCKILIETIDQNNNRLPFKTLRVSGLQRDQWYTNTISIPTQPFTGRTQVVITVDSGNDVDEQVENNNTFILPFYVRRDTSRPRMEVTFDGIVPHDGDYVRPTPEIRVKLFDNGILPITDVTNFIIFQDDSLKTQSNTQSLRLEPGKDGEKVSAVYTAQLTDGEHVFKFNVKNGSGNLADTTFYIVRVFVQSDSKIISFYNYPNPFSRNTTFIFNMTGTAAPDALSIKIYTVAGRMIKEMKVPVSQLRIGYNNIAWDGRDADGDELGNGVYFYKVIVTRASKNESLIGKIAVVK